MVEKKTKIITGSELRRCSISKITNKNGIRRKELKKSSKKGTALSFKIALHSQRLCYFIVGRCPDG
ncbi:MAG: hypothetical protein K1V90_01295, partial [Muribaculaceae bacterium]